MNASFVIRSMANYAHESTRPVLRALDEAPLAHGLHETGNRNGALK